MIKLATCFDSSMVEQVAHNCFYESPNLSRTIVKFLLTIIINGVVHYYRKYKKNNSRVTGIVQAHNLYCWFNSSEPYWKVLSIPSKFFSISILIVRCASLTISRSQPSGKATDFDFVSVGSNPTDLIFSSLTLEDLIQETCKPSEERVMACQEFSSTFISQSNSRILELPLQLPAKVY